MTRTGSILVLRDQIERIKEEKRKMNCPRCGAKFVTPERFYGEDGIFDGWRCIMCGDVFDEVILERREIQRSGGLLWDTREEMIFLDQDLVIGVSQKKL